MDEELVDENLYSDDEDKGSDHDFGDEDDFFGFRQEEDREDLGGEDEVDYEEKEQDFQAGFHNLQNIGGHTTKTRIEKQLESSRDKTLQSIRITMSNTLPFSNFDQKGKSVYQFLEKKLKNIEDFNPLVLVIAGFIHQDFKNVSKFKKGFEIYGRGQHEVNEADVLRYYRVLSK